MRTLDRRTVLKGLLGGAAVSMGLPLLEIMLDTHGEALATGDPLPDRFGVWFWGNGVRPERWVPHTTGVDWTPHDETLPLLPLREYVSVVSGCEIKTATHPHHSGMTGVMTGKHYLQVGTTRDTIVSTFDGPSVDVIASNAYNAGTSLQHLEVGVTRFRGTDEGTTFQHLSHNGPNAPNPSEYDPRVVWNRLFGGRSELDPTRRSVLDAVADQTTNLRRRLGAADQARLDMHYAAVRDLERRLEEAAPTCGTPSPPVSPVEPPGAEPIEEKNLIMSELVALALSCDATRVFSVLFSTAGSGVVWWQEGATTGLHRLCHDEAMPQPTVHAAQTRTMEQLAVFLETLRNTPDGAGNLLDTCGILCTTELTDGRTHSNLDFPILIAGKGNGRLHGNRHYRSTTNESVSKAVLTAMVGAGVPVTSFGDGLGYTDQTVGELLV
jgi:hypothetical protein